MAFDFSTLVTDRSSADVARVRNLISKLVSGTATEAEVAEFNSAAMRGAYNYTDLNRVNAAMDEINQMFVNAGYYTLYKPFSIKRIVTNLVPVVAYSWIESDIPTATQLQAMLTNVEALRSVVNVLDSTPQTPENMDLLTLVKANNIEKILYDIWCVINAFLQVPLRSGAPLLTSSSSNFYFAN